MMSSGTGIDDLGGKAHFLLEPSCSRFSSHPFFQESKTATSAFIIRVAILTATHPIYFLARSLCSGRSREGMVAVTRG